MFYVGNEIWMERQEDFYDLPGFKNFSGCIRYSNGDKAWYVDSKIQSFQDLVTQEWMPAIVWADGRKDWYNKDEQQSFQNSVTKEWMPAVIWYDGSKEWYDKGMPVRNPETYHWKTIDF